MFAELHLILHEVTGSLRRGRSVRPASDHAAGLGASVTVPAVVVRGLASAGKARLVEALRQRLAPAHVVVLAGAAGEAMFHDPLLSVYAETDLEALVEGGAQAASRSACQHADLRVPVDWERVDRSVGRVLEALHARGVDVDEPGA